MENKNPSARDLIVNTFDRRAIGVMKNLIKKKKFRYLVYEEEESWGLAFRDSNVSFNNDHFKV